MTHVFYIFNASLKAHTHMQTMLEKIYLHMLYGLIMLSMLSCIMFIYYANVYLTHDLPMHQLTCLIVLEYVDM